MVDVAKIEGLRFELECGLWRADVEGVAERLIDDAEYAADDGSDE